MDPLPPIFFGREGIRLIAEHQAAKARHRRAIRLMTAKRTAFKLLSRFVFGLEVLAILALLTAGILRAIA